MEVKRAAITPPCCARLYLAVCPTREYMDHGEQVVDELLLGTLVSVTWHLVFDVREVHWWARRLCYLFHALENVHTRRKNGNNKHILQMYMLCYV